MLRRLLVGAEVVAAAVAIAAPIAYALIFPPAVLLGCFGVVSLISEPRPGGCGCLGRASVTATPNERRIRGVYCLTVGALILLPVGSRSDSNLLAWGLAVLSLAVVPEVRRLVLQPAARLTRYVVYQTLARFGGSRGSMRVATSAAAFRMVRHLLSPDTPVIRWRRGFKWLFLSWTYEVEGVLMSANVGVYLPSPEKSRVVLVRTIDDTVVFAN